MPRHRWLVLGVVAGALGSLLSPSMAVAGPGESAGWTHTASFLENYAALDDRLRAEVASDGRGMATFSRTTIDSPCGRSKTWVLGLDGRWRHRPKVEASNSGQVQLVAGRQLAWLGERCSDGVELHYVNRREWRAPAVLSGQQVGPLRAGMNASGVVALARPTEGGIEVFTARPDESWTSVEPLMTDEGDIAVDHVAVTDAGQIIVVWHAGEDMYVATLGADGWSGTGVPGALTADRVVVGSDAEGDVLIARAVDETLYTSFRAADGSVTEPEKVAEGLDYGCTYTCMAVEVLPGGDGVVGWAADGLELGRRDAATGEWTTELVARRFGALSVAMDTNVDGAVVLVDSLDERVYRCSWTSSCSRVDYPPGTDHGMFAAAPAGAVVGISGLSGHCDEICEFDHLDGWELKGQ